MEKEKMEQCKARLVEAAQWGRKQITPQRLKKGAGCLVALAIVAGGGKFAMHKAKAEARLQEAQAKTRMLQNMAAQQNITLVSTDAVKENIASTLGTDPSSITFQSITLDDRKPGEKKEERKDSRTGATSRQPGMPRPEMAKAANAFPGVYLARCEKDGMGYQFLVDAQSGQVLHGQVHKLNPIQQKAGWWR